MPECLFSGHLGGRKNRSRDCALRWRKQSQCCARHDIFYFTGASRGRLALFSDGDSRFVCSGETLIQFPFARPYSRFARNSNSFAINDNSPSRHPSSLSRETLLAFQTDISYADVGPQFVLAFAVVLQRFAQPTAGFAVAIAGHVADAGTRVDYPISRTAIRDVDVAHAQR